MGNAICELGLWKELARLLQQKEAHRMVKDDDGETTSKLVFDYMKGTGFRISKLSPPEKRPILGVYLHSIATCQLCGPDVGLMFAVVDVPCWMHILQMVSPQRFRQAKSNGDPDSTHIDFDQEAWDHYHWTCMLMELFTMLIGAVNNVGLTRAVKAAEVERLVGEVLKHWGSRHRTTHPHMTATHLGDDRSLPEGVDITQAQTQGVENKHQELKRD